MEFSSGVLPLARELFFFADLLSELRYERQEFVELLKGRLARVEEVKKWKI